MEKKGGEGRGEREDGGREEAKLGEKEEDKGKEDGVRGDCRGYQEDKGEGRWGGRMG